MSQNDGRIPILARKYALLNAIDHKGIANPGSVTGRILAEFAELRSDPKRAKDTIRLEVDRVNSLSDEAQARALEAEFPGALQLELAKKKEQSKRDSEKQPQLPELFGATRGSVVTRFPPEPNGFMHIGHAKAAIISSEYADKYDGRFIVRFDDTNPAAEKKEFYDAFRDGLSWLGIHIDFQKNASDDMLRFYELAEKMILERTAYACTCSQQEIRRLRILGEGCPCRLRPVGENLDLWRRMVDRQLAKNTAVIRFLGDMNSPNTTMRDPILFRIVDDPHPIQGNRYAVWPTYDFDGPVEDSLDGVTHAMRSKEYELRDELYYAVLRSLKLRQPQIIEFSRLSMKDTTVSKRDLKRLIEDGKVEGWDDPRLPTIFGLRKRGFLPEAIREFVLSMGVSKVESEPTWDLFESINRKLLDPIARRFFFVESPASLEVEGHPELEVRVKSHPERPLGERRILTDGRFLIPAEDAAKLLPGSFLRLIEAYTVKIESKERETIVATKASDEVGLDVRKSQWVKKEENIELDVQIPGPLFIDGEFNPQSLKTVRGMAEKSVSELKADDIVQFVRFGFCRIDRPGLAVMTHK